MEAEKKTCDEQSQLERKTLELFGVWAYQRRNISNVCVVLDVCV